MANIYASFVVYARIHSQRTPYGGERASIESAHHQGSVGIDQLPFGTTQLNHFILDSGN